MREWTLQLEGVTPRGNEERLKGLTRLFVEALRHDGYVVRQVWCDTPELFGEPIIPPGGRGSVGRASG